MTTSWHNLSCSSGWSRSQFPWWSEYTATVSRAAEKNPINIPELTNHFHRVAVSRALDPDRIWWTILDQALTRDPHLLFFVRIPLIKLSSRHGPSWPPASPSTSTHDPIHSGRYCYKVLISVSICAAQAHSRNPGHERSLTQIKFNKEGDLLFSCSKDHVINVWFSHNGERLGTYDGHNGTVWTIDVDCTSSPVLNLSSVNIINRPHQPNPDFSYPVRPITPSDCGPFSQANACTSGNFPQPSKAWLLAKPMIKSFA